MNEQEERERDLEWLGKIKVADLTDLSYGIFDLSNGSTEAWWNSIKEMPMTFLELEKFSDKELEDELKKRKEVEGILYKPEALNGIFPKELRKICEDYVNEVWDKGYDGADDNLEHYIFEVAVQTIFGKGIFEKLNKRSQHVTNDR